MPYFRYAIYVVVLIFFFFVIYRPIKVSNSDDCIYLIPAKDKEKTTSLINSLKTFDKLNDRNILVIYYDTEGCIYVNKDFKRIQSKLKLFRTFIMNPKGSADYASSPDSSWIIIKAANYKDIPANVDVLKSLRVELVDLLYKDLRNEGAKAKFGKAFKELSSSDQQLIKKKYPLNVVDDLWDQIENPSKPIKITPLEGYIVN